MMKSEKTAAFVERLYKLADDLGIHFEEKDRGGGSDGNHIAEMRVPVIDGCAPAGGGFHCDKEFLRLDTVEERIRMVTRFLTLI